MAGIAGNIACVIAMLLASGGAWAQQQQQQQGAGPTAGATKAGGPAGVGRIGIGTVGPANLPADLRIRLEDAAAAGLTASGAQVVSAAELSRARATATLGTCADPVCERRLAQITDIRYWLRGTCQLDTSTYRLHLELVDAQSGAVVAGRDDTCDICTEADAADLVNVAASSLKAALSRSRGSSLPPLAAATTAAPPTDAPQTGMIDRAPDEGGASATGGERPTWRRVLPWVAFAGAAAALAGGVYALTLDDGDCYKRTVECQIYWSDPAWRLGVPLLAIGAALATTGVILLRQPAGPQPGAAATATGATGATGATWMSGKAATGVSSTQVMVSPTGIAIAGRF